MNGGFSSLHPLLCFIYYTVTVLLCTLITHPYFLAAALVLTICFHLLADRGRRLRRWSGLLIAIGLAVLFINPLVSHRGNHILFYVLGNPITLEAVAFGAVSMLSVTAVISLFISFQLVVTPQRFLYLFSRISPKIALLMMMAMRFVPLLRRRLTDIAAIQRTRGTDPLHGPLRKRMSDAMKVLQILLTWSLEEAVETADSMRARGFGSGRRSTYERYAWSGLDRFVLGCVVITGAASLLGWGFGYGRWTVYPTLEPLRMNGLQWGMWVCFCLLLIIPVAIEGREKLRWRSWS